MTEWKKRVITPKHDCCINIKKTNLCHMKVLLIFFGIFIFFVSAQKKVLVGCPKTGTSYAHYALSASISILQGDNFHRLLMGKDIHRSGGHFQFEHIVLMIYDKYQTSDHWKDPFREVVQFFMHRSRTDIWYLCLERDVRETMVSIYDYMHPGDWLLTRYQYNRYIVLAILAYYNTVSLIQERDILPGNGNIMLFHNKDMRNDPEHTLGTALRYWGYRDTNNMTVEKAVHRAITQPKEKLDRAAKVPVDVHKTWQDVLTEDQVHEVECLQMLLRGPFDDHYVNPNLRIDQCMDLYKDKDVYPLLCKFRNEQEFYFPGSGFRMDEETFITCNNNAQ